MAAVRCKMCGKDLPLAAGARVLNCGHCGSRQTVPAADSQRKLALFREAEELRFAGKFDKAANVYKTITAEFPREAEAYWGLVLCKYGVEYVTSGGKRTPACRRTRVDSVMEDGDYRKALEYAVAQAKPVYQQEAEQLEQVSKGTMDDLLQGIESLLPGAETKAPDPAPKGESSIADQIAAELEAKKAQEAPAEPPKKAPAATSPKAPAPAAGAQEEEKQQGLEDFAALIAAELAAKAAGETKPTPAAPPKKAPAATPPKKPAPAPTPKKAPAPTGDFVKTSAPAPAPKKTPAPAPAPKKTPAPAPANTGAELQKKRAAWKAAFSVLSASGGHIVGLNADGTVMAAGQNSEGQCGVGDWRDIMEVSAGGYHTLGLKYDGTVVSVGQTSEGQREVWQWRGIKAVSAGGFHSVGLKADGTVVAVGKNDHGQCNVSNWRDITAIAAGYAYTLGLKADGTVVAVGKNDHGQCSVAKWANIVAVAAGTVHSVGLKADGTVVAAGDDNYGKCYVSEWKNVVSIAAAGRHTVGLKADGTVVATGTGKYTGQCRVSDWKNIRAVAAGDVFTLGVDADGAVKAAENNTAALTHANHWRLFRSVDDLTKTRQDRIKRMEAGKAARRKSLEQERETLRAQRLKATGLFAGGRRKSIDARLAQIEAELGTLA